MLNREELTVVDIHSATTSYVLTQTINQAIAIGKIEEQDRIIKALISAGKFSTVLEVMEVISNG